MRSCPVVFTSVWLHQTRIETSWETNVCLSRPQRRCLDSNWCTFTFLSSLTSRQMRPGWVPLVFSSLVLKIKWKDLKKVFSDVHLPSFPPSDLLFPLLQTEKADVHRLLFFTFTLISCFKTVQVKIFVLELQKFCGRSAAWTLTECDVQVQVRLTELRERERERLPVGETGSLTQH